MSDKPAILKDQEFVVEESILYKAMRTGAIWMNKLFFGSLTLLVVWLFIGMTGATDLGCADTINIVEGPNGTVEEEGQHCSTFLNPTSKYLAAMTILSFLLSVGFGLLGLVVGKNIIAMTPSSEEVGAESDDDS